MLMRDPFYLKQTSEQADKSERLPLVSKQGSQVAPSVLKEHPHCKMTGNDESEMVPLVSRDVSLESCGNRRTHVDSSQTDRPNCCSVSDQFGFFLLTDWKFVMLLVCVCLTHLSHMSLQWFIPDRAIEIGLSNHDAAMTITIIMFQISLADCSLEQLVPIVLSAVL